MGEASAKKEEWRTVTRFMADLFEALAESLKTWRGLLTKYDQETLEAVRDVRKLREIINEAPDEVRSALLDARLALEEVVSVLAGDAERLLDEEEFKHIIKTLEDARAKLSRALQSGGSLGGAQ